MKKRKNNHFSQENAEPSEKMCSLGEAHRVFDEYFDNFDINQIPLSVRKAAIKDYEEIYNDSKLASEEELNSPTEVKDQ